MKTAAMFALCLLFAGAGAQAAGTFTVSPAGDDRGPGTAAKPFKTVARARDALRAAGGGTVILRGGIYPLAETLRLDARDSGTPGRPTLYKAFPGETPVLSGGRRITGWAREENGRWSAPVPAGLEFRQLFVDGRRAKRARGPAPAGAKVVGDTHSQTEKAGFHVADAGMARWRNPGDVELGFFNSWSHMICKVASIEADPAGGAILWMQQPEYYLAANKEGVRAELPAYVENALELLDEPGEWYLDRAAHRLYYLPRPGEEMGQAAVIAPALERLLEVKGTLDRPAHDIRFEGLTFADATWLRPSRRGHVDLQANFVVEPDRLLKRDGHVTVIHNEVTKSPANVVLDAARAVCFEGCEFTRLGGAGLDVQNASQENVVRGCRFHDISGSAIQIGDVLAEDHHPKDPRRIVKGNQVVNCWIRDAGAEYEDSVGIFAGYTDGTVIAHNEVESLPYTGISVGWGWGEEDAGGGAYPQAFLYDTPSTCRNNRIEANHIHQVMCRRNDGGGVYTLGNQPGTVIRGNLIHDNAGAPGGIYTDEGSGFLEITGNVVYNVRTPYNQNNRAQGRDKTCREHDDTFGVLPGAPGFPQAVADAAGIEAAWLAKDAAGPLELELRRGARRPAKQAGYDPALPGYHLEGDIGVLVTRPRWPALPAGLTLAIRTSPGMRPNLEGFTLTDGETTVQAALRPQREEVKGEGTVPAGTYFRMEVAGGEVLVRFQPKALALLRRPCTIRWVDWYRQ